LRPIFSAKTIADARPIFVASLQLISVFATPRAPSVPNILPIKIHLFQESMYVIYIFYAHSHLLVKFLSRGITHLPEG